MPAKASWGLPKHAEEIWNSAYEAALKQYNGDEGKAIPTAWAAVKKKYKKAGDKWVAIKESRTTMRGGFISFLQTPVLESASADVEQGILHGVTLIQAGWTKDGKRLYPARTLASAAPVYDGARMFAGHGSVEEQTNRQERSIADWVGNVVPGTCKWDGAALLADVQMVKGNRRASEILEMCADPLVKNGLGLSHKAVAKRSFGEEDGRRGEIVESIDTVESVDWVISGNAGGHIRAATLESEETSEVETGMGIETLQELEHEHADLLVEYQEKITAPLRAQIALLEAQVKRAEKTDQVREHLTALKVPGKAQALVMESLVSAEHADAEALKAACETTAKAVQELIIEARPAVPGVGPTVPSNGGGDELERVLKGMGEVVKANYGRA